MNEGLKLLTPNRWVSNTLRGRLAEQLRNFEKSRNRRIFNDKVFESRFASLLAETELTDSLWDGAEGSDTAHWSPARALTTLIAVKDNVTTQHLSTTCASNILEGYISPEDATIVRLLRDAGVATLAKTNMDEFGMGSHTLNNKRPLYNGRLPDCISVGGSSGGSAMAVADGLTEFAIGTDTGGSVRLPAAYTSLVGFKPSYGLISRNGVVPYANSLDTVGVLASNIMNVYLLFGVLNHEDPKDPTCLGSTSRQRMPWLHYNLAKRRAAMAPGSNSISRLEAELDGRLAAGEEIPQSLASTILTPNSMYLTRERGPGDQASDSNASEREDVDAEEQENPNSEAMLQSETNADLLTPIEVEVAITDGSDSGDTQLPESMLNNPETTKVWDFIDVDLADAEHESTAMPDPEPSEDPSLTVSPDEDETLTTEPLGSADSEAEEEYIPSDVRNAEQRLSYPQRTRETYDPWLFDDYVGSTKPPKQRFRIGLPVEYNIEELHPDVRRAWVRTLTHLQMLGCEIVPISLPSTKQALSAYYVIAPAEASSNLAKYDGVRYGAERQQEDAVAGDVLYATFRGENFGDEVKRRILLGAYTLSAGAIDNYFIQAQKVRRLVQEDFNLVFNRAHPLIEGSQGAENGIDYIVCPTAPTPPPLVSSITDASPLQSYINDVFTVPASLAGLPALSVPTVANIRLPTTPGTAIGMQIIGQYGDDLQVLKFAQGYIERYQDWDGIQRVQTVKRDFSKAETQWWVSEEAWKRNVPTARRRGLESTPRKTRPWRQRWSTQRVLSRK